MRKIEITFCGIQFEIELQKLEEYEATYDSGGIFVAAAGHVPSKAIALLDEAVRKSISKEYDCTAPDEPCWCCRCRTGAGRLQICEITWTPQGDSQVIYRYITGSGHGEYCLVTRPGCDLVEFTFTGSNRSFDSGSEYASAFIINHQNVSIGV